MRCSAKSCHRARAPDMPGWMPSSARSVSAKPICVSSGMPPSPASASWQPFGDFAIAGLGRRFVVAVGKNAGYPEFAGQGGNFLGWPAVADDQPAAPGAQGGIEFEQRGVDEMNATVAP